MLLTIKFFLFTYTMRVTILDNAKEDLEKIFNESVRKAFTYFNLKQFLKRSLSQMSVNKSVEATIQYLLKKSKLHEHKLSKELIIYSWDTFDEFSIINAIKPNAYFTHYSSMYIHQLTLQIPKVFYLNYEHSWYPNRDNELTQEGIDNAFSKPQRKSDNIIHYDGKRIFQINGQYTGRLGVVDESSESKCYYYTDLERTLIDIAVRPNYSGGIFQVIDAYRNAKESMDPDKLYKYLKEMDFMYPYHQIIGFYLDLTGYDDNYIKYFQNNLEYNFYLTYEMRSKEYSKKWRLFYPKGINYKDV